MECRGREDAFGTPPPHNVGFQSVRPHRIFENDISSYVSIRNTPEMLHQKNSIET
jgi:hypothetical protein